MSCLDIEQVELYIRKELNATDLDRLEAHLKRCKKCRSRVAKAQSNEDLLPKLRRLAVGPSVFAQELTESDVQAIVPGQYVVLRKVSSPAQHEVFKALDRKLERFVAVKVMRTDVLECDIEDEQWQEARLMSHLEHPHIAQIYGIEEKDGVRCVIMEWVDGQPITEAWQDLSNDERLRIYMKVLDAIAAAHQRGIVHRDIKPSNILVTPSMCPKVLDFGISIQTGAVRHSRQDLYRGSPAYSAPEQVTPPFTVSAATDVFALGILLYQLLTETLPFRPTSVEKLFQAIRTENPPLPRSINECTPEQLQNICLRALAKEPRKRYRTAQGLLDAIREYQESRMSDIQGTWAAESDTHLSSRSSFAKGPFVSERSDQQGVLRIAEGDALGDRFVVIRRLGEVGNVHLVHDKKHDRRIAAKIVTIGSEGGQKAMLRLRHELFVRDRLDDFSHVVRSYDIHEVALNGLPLGMLTLEYADGGSLRSWLHEHRNERDLRIHKGLELLKQACYGVKVLHDAGLAHLDLKPENILLYRKGDTVSAKVSDLGASRILDPALTDAVRLPQREGGTRYYMSPEQFITARQKDVDWRADIYALGVILFEVVDGEFPFDDSGIGIARKHLEMEPPKVSGVDVRIQSIIGRCLAKLPGDRYLCALDLINDLNGLDNEARTDESTVGQEHRIVTKEDDLFAQAEACLMEGCLDKATDLCKTILDLRPDHREARCMLNEIKRMREEKVRIAEIDSLYTEAQHHMDWRDFAEAAERCSDILSLDPQHRGAKHMLETIEHRYEQAKELYRTIGRSIGLESTKHIEQRLHEVDKIYPGHPERRIVQDKLSALTAEFKSFLLQAYEARSESTLNPDCRLIDELLELRDEHEKIESLGVRYARTGRGPGPEEFVEMINTSLKEIARVWAELRRLGYLE